MLKLSLFKIQFKSWLTQIGKIQNVHKCIKFNWSMVQKLDQKARARALLGTRETPFKLFRAYLTLSREPGYACSTKFTAHA